jgi:syntaxin-binding protein 1
MFLFRQGSTHVVTPRQFVDDLKVLELSGIGSRAVPNGLRELRAMRPYQAFYDERYFTHDVPRALPQQQQQMQKQKAPPMGKSLSARSVGRPGPEPSSFTGSSLSVNSSSYASSPMNGSDKAGKKKKGFLRF